LKADIIIENHCDFIVNNILLRIEMKYNKSRFQHPWEDILQLWLSDFLKIVSKKRRNQISPFSHTQKVALIAKEFIKDFLKLFIMIRIPKNKIWFFSISSNNYESLKLIQANVNDSIFITPFSFKSREKAGYHLNFNRKFLYDLFFPVSLFFFKGSQNKVKFYDLFFKTNGLYSEGLRLLKKSRPKAIIFANDHEIIPRAVLKAAKALEVPTFYIQHAAVSQYFPVLDFDYALLEGQDSKDKYLGIGETNSKIHLVGMPKFDEHINHVNQSTTIENIGIAFNTMDELGYVLEIVRKLKDSFPKINFIIRPHPSDERKLNLLDDIEISNAKKETAFNFLKRVDAIIAGESSILLEAAMLNVYPMCFGFSNVKFLDYYGFVKNNLVQYFDKVEDLNLEIKKLFFKKPNIQERAMYFNAAINTEFYGKSSLKCSQIILETIQKEHAEE